MVFGVLFLGALPASAQDELALRTFFEGRRVRLKIDMPATSQGVDLRLDRERPLDFKEYGDRLKRYGASIKSSETSIVTLIKVKKDMIEFQIGGGGFGTSGDDSSSSVSISSVDKSNRERELEKALKTENESSRRKVIQRELDELRRQREVENHRLAAERMQVEEQKKARIAEQRLRGGSRFNIRYGRTPERITPEYVMSALAGFVDFPTEDGGGLRPPAVSGTAPFKGMLRGSAEQMFGAPIAASSRREGSLTVTTATFERGEQRIIAEFVEDVMIRYSIASR
jgi:hypothetical protein